MSVGAMLRTSADVTRRRWRSPGMAQYKSRAQRRRHHLLPPGLRAVILDRDAGLCFYCEYEATEIDHIIPYTYGGSDEEENLVACCDICNKIASNKIFDTIAEKRAFVRSRYGPYLEGRARRIRKKLSLCGDCLMVFTPNVNGASFLLCGECYEASETGRRKRLVGEDSPEYDVRPDAADVSVQGRITRRQVDEKGAAA